MVGREMFRHMSCALFVNIQLVQLIISLHINQHLSFHGSVDVGAPMPSFCRSMYGRYTMYVRRSVGQKDANEANSKLQQTAI